MTVLEELEQAVVQTANTIGPSIVGVSNHWRGGSGVVVADGKVLTNAHNIRGESVAITFADGRSAEASIAGLDVDGDLAVLNVDTSGIPPIDWSSNGAPQLGSVVVALANPMGRGLRVTFGVVSGTARSFRGPRGRRISGSVEHTALLAPGSSGGPIVNRSGQFVGLNTSRMGDGFYLAIPADAALRQQVDALGRGKTRERPRLGIGIAPSHVARRLRRAVGLPERDGILVRAVEESGPAAAAGFQEGDLIVGAADREITDVDQLHEILDSAAPGSTLELRVVRGAEERVMQVQLPG